VRSPRIPEIGDNRAVAAGSDSYRRIYAVVRRIPRGRVATYGQVATLAGLGGHARQVGYAMHALGPDDDVPWHRVVNAQGRVSARAEPGGDQIQRQLLEREGVRFDAAGRVDLERFGWKPRKRPQVARSEPKASEDRTGEADLAAAVAVSRGEPAEPRPAQA
jgi:methylated-DNA-protein-cysteine methyltransferase-like protein